MGECHPFRSLHPWWKWLVTLIEEVKCPHSGGRGMAAWDQFASLLTGHCMGSIRHGAAGGQGDVFRYHDTCQAVTQITTLVQMKPYFIWWNFIVITKIRRIHRLGTNFMEIHSIVFRYFSWDQCSRPTDQQIDRHTVTVAKKQQQNCKHWVKGAVCTIWRHQPVRLQIATSLKVLPCAKCVRSTVANAKMQMALSRAIWASV